MPRFVVIGAGPSGIACATRLAARPDAEVIVVDAGRYSGRATGLTAAAAPVRRWELRGDLTRQRYLGGTGLGGGALINGAVWGVTPPSVPHVDVRPANRGEVSDALVAATRRARTIPNAETLWLLGTDPWQEPSRALGLGATVQVLLNTPAYELCVDGERGDQRRVVGVFTAAGELSADAVFVAAGTFSTPMLLADSGIPAGYEFVDHAAISVTTPLPSRHPHADQVAGPDVHAGVVVRTAAFTAYAFDQIGVDRRGIQLVFNRFHRTGRVARHPTTGAVVVDADPLDAEMVREAVRGAWPEMAGLLRSEPIRTVLADATVDQWGTRLGRVLDQDATPAWISNAIGGLYHAAGTCALTVDPAGAVPGYRGLFVADLSRSRSPHLWSMRRAVAIGSATAQAATR